MRGHRLWGGRVCLQEQVMRMGLCWRQELPLFMGAGESSTPCPGENEEGFKLTVYVLPCFKGHVTLKAAREMLPGSTCCALVSTLGLRL